MKFKHLPDLLHKLGIDEHFKKIYERDPHEYLEEYAHQEHHDLVHGILSDLQVAWKELTVHEDGKIEARGLRPNFAKLAALAGMDPPGNSGDGPEMA